MSGASSDKFISLFDDQGRYQSRDGEEPVVFLTKSGVQYPGRLRFKSGLLVRVEMGGASHWENPDASPIDGLRLPLHFSGERPRALVVEEGRMVHNFELQDRVAKARFLTNFRIARNLFFHARVESDGLDIGTTSSLEDLTRAALWLTPQAVAGFDVSDFPELPLDRQSELSQAVQAFEAIASQVPAGQPPTQDQYCDAAKAFGAMVSILSPYLPTTEESQKVEIALGKVDFPAWVVNWDFELGSSEDGDAAVWVDVFAERDVARADFAHFIPQIVPKIRAALTAEGVDRWPYVRLRFATEYKTA